MKTIKKQIFFLSLFVILLSTSLVYSISLPNKPTPLAVSPGGLNLNGNSCTLYNVKDEHCGSGDIRIYQQCNPTIQNGKTIGVWEQRSINCGEQGDSCLAGKCLKKSKINLDAFLGLFSILLIGGLIYWRVKRK